MNFTKRFVSVAAAICALAAIGEDLRVAAYPQSFDAGGWGLDVQFMDTVGSPYLIAHGCGLRVVDAIARIEVPKSGKWNVWVRSRKWVEGAGRFKVSVGGREIERLFGEIGRAHV